MHFDRAGNEVGFQTWAEIWVRAVVAGEATMLRTVAISPSYPHETGKNVTVWTTWSGAAPAVFQTSIVGWRPEPWPFGHYQTEDEARVGHAQAIVVAQLVTAS